MAPFLLILALSLSLNLCHNTFPLGYHADEIKKVKFIRNNTQDFMHPILLLQMNRVGMAIFGRRSHQEMVVSGRTLNGILGAGLALVSCLLVEARKGWWSRALISLAAASSPILVAHAHYLKEDIPFALFSTASLILLLRVLEEPAWPKVLLLGLTTGLACSSKYPGVLLFGFYAMAPWLAPLQRKKPFYARLGIILLVAAAVFAVVNYPIFTHLRELHGGLSHEARHAKFGHDVRIYPLRHLLGFHLVHSLAPGLTIFVLAPALAYLVWIVIRWRHAGLRDRILAAYAVVFYMIAEASPLKPFPDFMRYMMPIVPVLILFAYQGITLAASRLRSARPAVVVPSVCLVMVVPALYESIQIVRYFVNDTRVQSLAFVAATGQRAVFEQYAGTIGTVHSLADLQPGQAKADGVRYLVASSFRYGRFEYLDGLEGKQDPEVYRRAAVYQGLFRHPYHEIRPAYKSFAFSNPTIRIIDLGVNPAPADPKEPTNPGQDSATDP